VECGGVAGSKEKGEGYCSMGSGFGEERTGQARASFSSNSCKLL